MSPEDKAVYFNAVPLFILAGAYLMVAAALAPTLWRERRRVSVTDVGLAAIFPAIGIAAGIFAAEVLHDRSPIGGHVWPAFVATLVALVPALIFLRRWSEPAGVVMSGARAREAEELVGVRDRELESVARIVNALARIKEPVDAARVLLDEVEGLIGTEFNALALVNQDEDEAVGLLARSGGEDVAWWSEARVHLHNEPSGIASAFFEAAPVSVYDCDSSPLVNPRLARTAGAKSAGVRAADRRGARDRRDGRGDDGRAARVRDRGGTPDGGARGRERRSRSTARARPRRSTGRWRASGSSRRSRAASARCTTSMRSRASR